MALVVLGNSIGGLVDPIGGGVAGCDLDFGGCAQNAARKLANLIGVSG